MAGDLSGQTTNLSNLSVGGRDSNGAVFGEIWAGSAISAPTFAFSQLTVATSLNITGGIQTSGVTFDMRTNSVIPSSKTYAGGASISGLTIGQWGFVFNASGFSIAFSSGKTAYFFGGSTLSAAIT